MCVRMTHDALSTHETALSDTAVVRLQCGDDHALIARHGAQALSWHCAGRERLYLSPRAVFASGQAIRGGVPVIFPQFSDRGPGLRHGFARLREWDCEPGTDPAEARFVLRNDTDSERDWPHLFRAELAVALQESRLSIALQITNMGAEVFAFTAALHTYLRVRDLAAAQLQGLEQRPYFDSTQAGAAAIQPAIPLRFVNETDRIYPEVPSPLLLAEGGDSLRIEKDAFPDVVVWNPGAVLGGRMGDLGPGEHNHFVCVEAACVATPIQLAPGASWQGRQILTIAP